MKIKICGLGRMQDIEAVNEALPDYIGFVFAESTRKVSFKMASALKIKLDYRIKSVGVFVDAPIEQIVSLCRNDTIDLVQLHGNEDDSYIEELSAKVANPLIKAIRLKNSNQLNDLSRNNCEYMLLDTFVANSFGGSGKSFDWSIIPEMKKPFFLAGGLNAENLRDAAKCRPYCLDLSSGVETDGYKDRDKIIEVVKIAKSLI